MGLMNVFKESVNVSAKYETSLRGLESVSKAFGVSAQDATKSAMSLTQDGLVPLNQASQTLKNLIATGYSLDEAYTLANALKNIGAFNNNLDDLGLAMETSSRGFRINSIELIDNIGLTERLSSILKKAGVDISQGIALTESATQRQALYNAVLKESQKFSGDAATYSKTFAGALDKTKQSVTEFQSEFGNMLKGPAGEFLKIFSSGVKEITLVIKRAGETRAQEVMAADLMNPRKSMYNMSSEQLQKSRDALQKEFDKNKDTFFSGGRKNNGLFATVEQMRIS